MTVDDVARVLNRSRSTAHEYVREWHRSGLVSVRVERTGARGRPRYVVDATPDELLYALVGVSMAA